MKNHNVTISTTLQQIKQLYYCFYLASLLLQYFQITFV